jgi:hypothetical protein
MIAKNHAHKERKVTPGNGVDNADERHRGPKDQDREIIDLIDVIDQEIAAKAKQAAPRRESAEIRVEEPPAPDTLELQKPLILQASEPGEAMTPSMEILPAVEEDPFSELLEDLETTERAVAQEAAATAARPNPDQPPGDPDLDRGDLTRREKYYPRALAALDKQIAARQQDMERELSELKTQREQLQESFAALPMVLAASGDDLKKAVVHLFSTFWKLKISELDATTRPSLKENLLVEHNGRRIVFKIKATTDSYPSVKYITQLWQDLHYSGLGSNAEAGLILNHQVQVDPNHRGLAYIGDEEEHLEDITFVDTRVLYDLTLAIIDHGLPTQEAAELLLKKGRVKSHLDNTTA